MKGFAQVDSVITTSRTFIVPAGVTSITIDCWGGGGGSGGCVGNTKDNASGGGGGGAFSQKTFTVVPGQSLTVTVGAGGTAGAATGTAGGTGFSSTVTGSSPTVSITALGGGGSAGVTATTATGAAGNGGAAGVVGTGYDVVFGGGNGSVGVRNTSNEVGGAGGGGAGNAGTGSDGTSTTAGTNTVGGPGGTGSPNSAPFIGATGSAGISSSGSTAGIVGTPPGGGAAGASCYTTAVVGAVGGAGQVVLIYSLPQAVFYSKSTGNLDVLTNWGTNTDGSGTAPTSFTLSNQTFNIRNNATPTIGAAWTVSGISSLVVLGDGTTAINFTEPATFTFTGTLNISNNATFTDANASVPTFGTINANSTVNFASTSAQTIPAVSFGNLTSSSTGARTLASTGTIGIAATFTPGTNTYTITGSTINFLASSAQTIPAFSYNNLTNTGNGARTLASTGNINIAGTTFTPGTGTYTIAGSTVQLNGTTGFILTLPTVASGNSFNTLNITGSGTYTMPASSSTQNLANTLNISAGTFVLNPNTNSTIANTVSVGTISISGGTLDDQSTLTGTTTILQVSSAWNQTAGVVTNTGSGVDKIVFTGGGATTFTGLTPSTNFQYFYVQVSNNTTTTLASALTVNNVSGVNFILDAGSTFIASTFLINTNATGNSYTIAGTFKTADLAGFSGTATSTLVSTNSPTVTITGSTIEYNGVGSQIITARTDYTNVTIGDATTPTVTNATAAGSITATGNLLINPSATFIGGTALTHTIGGNWTNNGTYTIGTSTVSLNGTTQTISGTTSPSTFYNLTLAGSGTKTLGVATTISATETINSGVVENLGTFSSNANALTLNGVAQSAGTYGGTGSGATYIIPTYFSATSGVLTVGTNSCIPGTWIGNISTDWFTANNWCGGVIPTATTNVIIPSGAPNQPTIGAAGAVCNNLTINSGATLTITVNGTNGLAVSGNWVNAGTFTPNSSTVTFNSSASQTVNNLTQSFYNINHSGTGTLQLVTNALIASDSLYNSGGGTVDMAGKNLTIGNLTGSGTITSSVTGALILAVNGSASPSAFSGIIQEGTATTVSLTKSGTGTLTLSGANTYKGATTITAGTISANTLSSSGTASSIGTGITTPAISIGATGVLQYTGTGSSSSRAITLTASGATIDASGTGTLTLSGAVGGNTFGLTLTGSGLGVESGIISTTTGTVNKSGTGIWTLAAANTYTGLTTVGAGTLKLGVSSTSATAGPVGAASTGTSVTSGAALDLNGFSLTTAATEPLTLNGTGVSGAGALTNSAATASTYSGLVTLGSASTITGSAGTIAVSNAGTITGSGFGLTLDGAAGGSVASIIGTVAGTLTKTGAGTWTLSGASTYTGAVTVSAGVLNIQNATATGTTAGGVSVASGAALQIQGGITVGTEALSLSGTGVSSDGAFRNISGANTWGGAVTLNTASIIQSDAGTLTLSNASAITGTNTNLTLQGAGSGAINGIIAIGTGTLTQTASGTWTLAGADTYTGITTISAGTLSLNGTSGSNNVIVGNILINGGTLAYTSSSYSQISDNSNITLSSGTYNLTTSSEVIGSLTMTGGTLIKGGSALASDILQLANPSSITGGTLNFTTQKATLNVGDALSIGNATFNYSNGATAGTNTLNLSNAANTSITYAASNTGPTIFSNGSAGAGEFQIENGATTTFNIASASLGQPEVQVAWDLTEGTSASALTKTGTGILQASGTVAYTGVTTISAGEFRLNPAANLSLSTQIILNGGTLGTTNITSGRTITSSSTLQLAANSSINLGSNAHTITFANSSAVTWAGSSLTINGWTGTAGASGTAGKIFVGVGGLTAAQLAKITFTGFPGTPIILATGELVPTGPILTITGTTNNGSSCIGTAATPITYTITNTGASASGIAVASNNTQFVVSGLSSTTIANSGTATFQVTFTPTSAGAQTATITVTSTTANSNSPAIGLTGSGDALTAITTNPTGATYCQNATATALTVSATGTGTLSYQWYNNGTTNSTTGGTAVGTNSSSYTPSTTTAGTTYYYVVVTGTCGTTKSATAAVVVNASTVITANPTGATYCQNATATALSVVATGTGTLSYQWYNNGTTNSTTGGTAVGTNSSSYTPSTTTAGTTYYYVVVTGTCGTATSTTAAGVVNPSTVITVNPSGATYCQNATATALTVTATGTGTLSYQWYNNGTTNSTTGGTAVGTNSSSYTPSTTTAGTTYYYVVVTGTCGTATSTTAAVVVNPSTVITVSPTGATYCQNATATALTVTATGTGTLSYQWYNNGTTNSTTGGTAVGTNSSSYTPSTTTAGTTYYYVVVTGTCGTATSTTATVTVNPLPTATISGTTSVCQNSTSPNITFTGANGTAPYTFTYTINGGSNQTVTTTSGNSVTVSVPTTTAGTYTYSLISISGRYCSQPQSGTATVTVTAAPSATISYSGSPYCSSGGTATVTMSGTTGGTYSSTTGLVIDGPSGDVNLSSSTAGTYTVTYTVAAAGGCAVYTTTASITIAAAASATINYYGSPYCPGTGTASVTQTGTTGGTYTSTTGLSINSTTGAVDLSLSTSGTYTVTYSVSPATGCSGVYTTTALLTIGVDTWTGVTSTDWNDGTNWSCGHVPSINSDAVIPAVGGYYPSVSTAGPAATVHNLTINSGASLTVTSQTLQVSDSINNSGTFDVSIGTLELNGRNPQFIPAGAFTGNKIRNLVISNNVSLNGTDSLTGNLSFGASLDTFSTNANLTLRSTASRTGSVGIIANGNAISGNVTVERYIATGPGTLPSDHAKSWELLAVPTMGQTINQSWMEGATASNVALQGAGASNPKPGYGTMITSNVANAATFPTPGFDAYTAPGPTVKAYNYATNSYVGPATTGAAVYDQRGWFTFVRGDRSVYTASGAGSTADHTILRTTGTLITPAVSQPVSTVPAGYFQSVGNPFASPVDMTRISATGGMINQYIYVWDPRVGGSYNYGAFVTLQYDGTNYEVQTNGGYSYPANGTVYNYIQSGQAFFMYANAANGDGTVTFPETAKVPDTTFITPFTRQGDGGTVNSLPGTGARVTGTQTPSIRTSLNTVNADGSTGSVVDQVLNQYDDSYSNSVDGYDGRKAANTGENLSINTTGTLLVVEKRHTIVGNDTIFLNLTSERVQAYQFNINAGNLSTVDSGFIIDNYLNTRRQLNLKGNTKVNFNVVNVAGSYAANRFELVFVALKVLPSTIASVRAYQQSRGSTNINVDWSVSNEHGIQKYVVERSADSVTFTRLTVSKPTANDGSDVSYSVTDSKPLSGTNYYRIRMVDTLGNITYSVIVSVNIGAVKNNIEIYPNPVTDGKIHLQFSNEKAGKYGIRLLDKSGQVISEKQITRQEGNSTELLEWNYNIAHGIYKVEITRPDGSTKNINVLY